MTTEENKESKDDYLKDGYTKDEKDPAMHDDFNGNGMMPNEKHVDFGLDFCAVVTEEETASQAEENRRIGRRVTCCIFSSVSILFLTVVAIFVIPTLLRPKDTTKKFNCYTQEKGSVVVSFNDQLQTIEASESYSLKTKGVKFLLAYKTRMMAYHKGNECYIVHLDETFEEGKLRLHYHMNIAPRKAAHLLPISEQPMNDKVMKNICGNDIFKFCERKKSIWAKDVTGTAIAKGQQDHVVKV